MKKQRLTSDDKVYLLRIHRAATELIRKVAERLMINESDNHPNSWWLSLEGDVESCMTKLKKAMKRFAEDRA